MRRVSGQRCSGRHSSVTRDLIASLREEGLIAAGPRSPKLGAPYAYVTTEKFLFEFGFESLRDLPDLEALKDAGLLSGGASKGEGDSGELQGQRSRWSATAGSLPSSPRVTA